MTEQLQVQLERARDANGHLGSFGLSILGGHGTKFPAVVCEVEPGGPADKTGLVSDKTCKFLNYDFLSVVIHACKFFKISCTITSMCPVH